MPTGSKRKLSSKTKENESSANSIDTRKTKTYCHPRGQSQSCHQCRQSIFSSKGVGEIKLGQRRIKCASCTRYWCENCLRNRYGLERSTLEQDVWQCPVCTKTCNCSVCRRKNGKLATGILTPVVKNAGFSSVSEFLEKGTDDIAKCLQWKTPELMNKQVPVITDDRKPPKKKRKVNRPRSHKVSDTEEDEGSDECHLNHPEYSITCNDTSIELSTNEVDCDPASGMTERRLRNGRVVRYSSTSNGHQQLMRRNRSKKRKSGTVRVRHSVTSKQKVSSPPADEPSLVEYTEEKHKLNELRVKALEELRDKRKEEMLEQVRANRMEREEKRKAFEMQKMEARLEKRRKQEENIKQRMKLEEESMRKLLRAKLLVMKAKQNRKERIKGAIWDMKHSDRLPVQFEDDGPNECTTDNIHVPDLPSMTPFKCDIASWCIPQLIMVCEFLHCFSVQLELPPVSNNGIMNSLLHCPHYVWKVYMALLKVIAEFDDDLKRILCNVKGGKREVKKVVRDYVTKSGIQKVITLNAHHIDIDKDCSVEQQIFILDHLCHLVMESNLFTELLENEMSNLETNRKLANEKKSQLVKELSAQLMSISDKENVEEEIEKTRNIFYEKLQQIRAQYQSVFSLHGQCLGRDRFDRVYWNLRSFPGIMVETVESVDEDGSGSWSYIDSNVEVKQYMDYLHKKGHKEAALYNNLKHCTIFDSIV